MVRPYLGLGLIMTLFDRVCMGLWFSGGGGMGKGSGGGGGC